MNSNKKYSIYIYIFELTALALQYCDIFMIFKTQKKLLNHLKKNQKTLVSLHRLKKPVW